MANDAGIPLSDIRDALIRRAGGTTATVNALEWAALAVDAYIDAAVWGRDIDAPVCALDIVAMIDDTQRYAHEHGTGGDPRDAGHALAGNGTVGGLPARGVHAWASMNPGVHAGDIDDS